MKFRLDGEDFELTVEQVRTSLRGHSPESVRDYWVEINGARWPVKQVISVATGVTSRQRFQSQSSQRWLRNLGLPVGGGAGAGPPPVNVRPPRGSGSPRRSTMDVSDLPVIESVEMQVAFSWRLAGQVIFDEAGLPAFPRLPHAPGLYRYDFGTDAAGQRTLYIGESVDLARRSSNYRNAKTDRSRQRTSRRLHKEIVAHLRAGGSIDFALATVVTSTGTDLDLRLKSARRLAENAAVLLAQREPLTRVLNIDAQIEYDSAV